MSVNLRKGGRIDLRKGLNQVTVILGWKENTTDTGGDFDLDSSVFLLNNQNKAPSENDFIFYGNLEHPSGAVKHMGDDKTGSEGEEIQIELDKVPEIIQKIVFVVTIYDAKSRNQNFGMVEDAYIKLLNNETGEEIARYDLAEDFSIETGVNFGELYKKDGQWKFKAVGMGYNKGLSGFLKEYGLEADEESSNL